MTHKKILLFVLSFSLHSVIMGMDPTSPRLRRTGTEKADVQGAPETELEYHAHNLTQNIYNLILPEVRNTHIPPLIQWLVQKRNEIVDPTEWSDLIKQLEASIELPKNDLGSNLSICIPQATKNTIIKHATDLQSHQNTAELIEKLNKSIDDTYCYNVILLSGLC